PRISMRLSGLAALLSCLSLAACSGLGPHPYDRSAEPHALITGSHEPAALGATPTFRVVKIDGWAVNTTVAPAASLGIDESNTLAVGRPVRVDFEGLLLFSNPGRTIFEYPARVDGHAEFVPVAGARYAVRGEIGSQGSRVWLEDAATHERLGEVFG